MVADLSRAQRRVEATITALGQLASGQLAQDEDRELDRRRRAAGPGGPGEHAGRRRSRSRCGPTSAGTGLGLAGRTAAGGGQPGAQRHHSRPCDAASCWPRTAATTRWTIIVDDNGCGLPAEEYDTVLGRFARGSTAAAGGSGLGLALVAQQAALHGGRIELSDGPLGGLRATLTVSDRCPFQPRDSPRATHSDRRHRRSRHHDEADGDARPLTLRRRPPDRRRGGRRRGLPVLVFCTIGRRSHAEGVTLAGVAETAWPFLTGTAGRMVAARLAAPDGRSPRPASSCGCAPSSSECCCAGPRQGIALSFVVGFGGDRLLLLGWRGGAAP